MLAIATVIGKPPTESVFFEKYARICTVIDEILYEVGLAGQWVWQGPSHLGGI